jgi:DNA-damage-inducible protein J
MTATTMLHVRMDEKTKAEAMAALAAMGLTAAEAVRILFHRIVADQAFPLELKVPNAETRAAMEEAREISREMRRTGKGGFANAQEMFASLEKAGVE